MPQKERAISSRFSVPALLSLLTFPFAAQAVGLGDITLHSRIGEPLSATVTIIGQIDEPIRTACFSLINQRSSEFPVVTGARTQLIQQGALWQLSLTGNEPIYEPVFLISLRAACGITLQRDYVLMPAPPLSSTTPISAPSQPPPRTRPAKYRMFTAQQGQTLVDIAAENHGEVDQQRLLSALRRANPDLPPTAALAEGTPVRIPKLLPRPAPPPKATETKRDDASPAPVPTRPLRRDMLASLAPAGKDRVLLGPEPDELKPGETASPQIEDYQQMGERMLKLETRLHSLDQQMDNLNAALKVTAEAIGLRQKLAAAKSAQIEQSAPPEPPPRDESGPGNWLELVLSALLGGGVAAGLAHILSHRSEQTRRRTSVKA